MVAGAGKPHLSPATAATCLLLALSAWLLAAAMLVDIEYYDGFDTLCNARFFLGRSEFFITNRTPLMGWILVPAEFIKDALHLPPLELRPHHLTMALLHMGYLVGVYLLLARRFGRTWAVFMAYVTAIPQYIFFSYTPFINHDILPGILFLLMLILADRFIESPRWHTWAALVLIGSAAALIKHTYALFWIAVWISYAILALPCRPADRNGSGRTPLRGIALLACGGILSGVITWLVLTLTLHGTCPGKPALLRPLYQIQSIMGQYKGHETPLFPAWIYIRNLPAYGLLTTLLLLPALAMAFRGPRLHRAASLSWLIACAAMQALSTREVRYMAFLMPVTAFLMVPLMQWLLQRRWAVGLAGTVLLLDAARVAPEAALITQPFYAGGTLTQFLQPLIADGAARRPVLINWTKLSFPAPEDSPLTGDRYHKMFHFGTHHLQILFGYGPDDAIRLPPGMAPDAYPNWPDGAVVILSNRFVTNSTDWQPHPALGKAELRQIVAVDTAQVFRHTADGHFVSGTGQNFEIRAESAGTGDDVVLAGEFSETPEAEYLTARLLAPDWAHPFNLEPIRPGMFRVRRLSSPDALRQEPQLCFRALRIERTMAPQR